MKKFIVAIHGIGNQRRSATIRTVATQFGELGEPPLAIEPLGYFDLGSGTSVGVRSIELQSHEKIGFAEVYWANIPREIALRNDTLDESKFWGRTVASRAQELFQRARGSLPAGKENDAYDYYKVAGFNQATGVIEEFVEGVGVIENLLFIAAKAVITKLELEPLLSDYVGGVQLVADFKGYRNEIIGKFHSALRQVVRFAIGKCACADPEVYIIAHSEGSVIAFAGLLQALHKHPDASHVEKQKEWVQYVRGLMTIGSPIDKHLLLFPGMWKELGLPSYPLSEEEKAHASPVWRDVRSITWYNFYDYGDPIGFELDTARRYLEEIGCDKYLTLSRTHDYGFSRYIFPGKAHNDYWTDRVVFRHFIYGVVGLKAPDKFTVQAPKTKWLAAIFSLAIPYVAALVLQLLAVFAWLKPFSDNVCSLPPKAFASTTIGIGMLLVGTTVAARLPRLVSKIEIRWWVTSALAFVIGAALCHRLFDDGYCLTAPHAGALHGDKPMAQYFVIAMFVVLLLSALPPWRPKLGRTILVGAGAIVMIGVVAFSIAEDTPLEHSLTPVVIGAAFFLYFWWLGMILFDLTFVWHRYIRRTVALDAMRDWSRKKLRPRRMFGRYEQ